MATSKPYQCLLCRLHNSLPPRARLSSPRSFHTSPSSHARKRFPSVPASALSGPEYRPYTAREKQLLALKYTPEQLRIIEAGEEAVKAEDIAAQGRMRTDPLRIRYRDDFASKRPVLDRDIEPSDLKPASPDEDGSGGGHDLVEGRNYRTNNKQTPAPVTASGQETEETDPHLLRLTQQTGLSKQEIARLRVKNLVSHRVVNQTRMGKIQSLYYLTIAGNEDGMVGVGEGKAAEDEDGRRQAMMNAVRNMRPVPRYEERTIFGEVRGKVGGTVVELSARPAGFGNRCQHLIFELARAAGISDLAARTPRSRNKMNVVKAAFQALTSQRLPEDVARGRGRKMVDARAVYYGGQVL